MPVIARIEIALRRSDQMPTKRRAEPILVFYDAPAPSEMCENGVIKQAINVFLFG
jgi:hypothetical protein